MLNGVLGDLAAGRGRIVLLTGAPGIGKTRLLTELATKGADGVTWLEGACHSYGGLPGWPFVEILLGWLGGEIGEPEIAIRTKARAGLGALFGDEAESVLRPLAGLLRIRLDTPPRPRRRRTLHSSSGSSGFRGEAGHRRDRGHPVGGRADTAAGGADSRAHRPCTDRRSS